MEKDSHNYIEEKKKSYCIKGNQKYKFDKNSMLCGVEDRLKRVAPVFFEQESKNKSYRYGYTYKGSTVLEGKFYRGECNNEEMYSHGISDFQNHVPEAHIQHLLNYHFYLKGRAFQMGREAYQFTKENNISLEDYLSIMSIIYPEMQDEEFKNGYYEAKEKSKTKLKIK